MFPTSQQTEGKQAEPLQGFSWSYGTEPGAATLRFEQVKDVQVEGIFLLSGHPSVSPQAELRSEAKEKGQPETSAPREEGPSNREGLGILLTRDGIVYGKASVSAKGDVRFAEGLFFKFPVSDGERYDMADFLEKRAGLELDAELPVRVRKGKVEAAGGTLPAWIYEAGPQIATDGTEYFARWFWVEGKGLVRVENFDTYGEIHELSAGGAIEDQAQPRAPAPPIPPIPPPPEGQLP